MNTFYWTNIIITNTYYIWVITIGQETPIKQGYLFDKSIPVMIIWGGVGGRGAGSLHLHQIAKELSLI